MDIRERTSVPGRINLELDQRELLTELSLLGQGAFSHRNSHSVVTASRNSMNPEVQHLPGHANGAILYGMSQYNGSRIQRSQDIQVSNAGNPCSYLASPYGTEQFPSPKDGLIGNPADAYARNGQFIEVGFPLKRRFSAGVPVNFQGPNSLASSECFIAHFNPIHGHAHSHLTGGDLMVQHLQPASNALWLEQPVNFNLDSGSWTWNQAPAGFGIHGDNGGIRDSESFNSGFHRYSEISGMSCSPNFQHPHSTMIQHFSHRIPPLQPHLQGQRGHNIHLHPHVAAATQRIPLSSAYGTMHQQFFDLEPRQTRDLLFIDRMAHNPHQGCVDPETMFRRHPAEDEASVRGPQALASDSNDIGDFADAYRDMRLDIEHMSYEELLALEERIGYVGTGLSEETITSQLKTRISVPCARDVNMEAVSRNEETNSCTICLETISNGKKIGILDCGHYYHADCLKQWLLIKNVCPICKSEALTR